MAYTYKWPRKDPDEVFDYEHDFGPELAAGDVIVPPGEALVETGDVVIDSFGLENHPVTGLQTVMRVWLSGGSVKESGDPEKLTLRVSTAGGRTHDVGITIPIRSN